MHGLEYGPIAIHYHLYGSSSFDDIPFDDTDEAFVGVGVYKDFDVHQVPEFFIGQSEYAFYQDNLSVFYVYGLFQPVTFQIGISRLFDSPSGFQFFHLTDQELPVESARMVIVDFAAFFHGHVRGVDII